MLVTQQPILRKFWHAVMPLSALTDGPKPFTLLGENIVLFLDADGQPAALRDRCCHRTAKLSKGWCVDAEGKACKQGNIQCGYHGWTYAPTGQVINIPQFEARGLRAFQPFPDKPGTMKYFQAPPEMFEDPEAMREWAGGAVEAGRRAGGREG